MSKKGMRLLVIRWVLLIAFFGIGGLAIVVAIAALVSFSSVGQVLEQITKTHVPAVINTIDISRQAFILRLFTGGNNPKISHPCQSTPVLRAFQGETVIRFVKRCLHAERIRTEIWLSYH